MLILHGEHHAASRQKLVELLQAARAAGRLVTSLTAPQLSVAELETTLGSSSLFEPNRTIVIEGLHSLPVGARRKQLIQLLSAATKNSSDQLQLVLWEKRALTATMIKQFAGAQAQEFKVSNAVFTWLDSLSPKPTTLTKQLTLLRAAISQEDAGLCWAMASRQIRLLLTAASGGKIAGAPFMQTKLRSQAKAFSLEHLLKLHAGLVQLDLELKQGLTAIPFGTRLEQWQLQVVQK